MVVDLSIHDKWDGNPHAHYLMTMREINENGFSKKKNGFSKKKNGDWDKNDYVLSWRKSYQDITNIYLEMDGFEQRICVDRYEKQGIDKTKTIHLGHYAHRLEQMGTESRRGNINREIHKANQEKEEINKEIALLQNKLEKEREHAEFWHDKIEHYRKVSEEVQRTADVLEHRLTQRGVSYLVQQQKNAETVLQRHQPPELPVEKAPQNPPAPPEGQQPSEFEELQQSSGVPEDSGHHSRFSSLRRKSDQEPEQEQVGRAPPPLPHRHPEGRTFAQQRRLPQERGQQRDEAGREHPPPLHRHQESRRFAAQQERKGERDQTPEKPPDHAPPGRAQMRRMVLAKNEPLEQQLQTKFNKLPEKEEEHHNRPSLSREERRLRFQKELAELRKEHVEQQAQEQNRDNRKREK